MGRAALCGLLAVAVGWAGAATAAATPDGTTDRGWSPSRSAPKATLLAKKKKKKKKKKDDDSDFGPDSIDAVEDNDSGVGVHREQEGVDTPYIVEMGGATEISSLSTEVEGSEPSSKLGVNIDGHVSFLIFGGGKLGLGPDLGIAYTSTSQKVTDATTNESKTEESTQTDLRLGPQMRFFFGKVDRVLTLPFLTAAVGYQMSSRKTGEDKLDLSGYVARFGGGLGLFLDSNIALVLPRAEYVMSTLSGKPKDAEKEVSMSTSGFRVLIEFMTFL